MNIKLMKTLCRTNQQNLLSYLAKYLKSIDYNVTETKDYVYAEGTLPIALVAHVDTVAEIGGPPPSTVLYDKDELIMMAVGGCCMDDRAGVYAILSILEDGYRPHVILTTGEEQGCLGAQALVLQKPECPLGKVKAIFQLDRRGEKDCVFYDCDNPDFTKYVESFGFVEAQGSFTDISILGPGWGVAAANLSIGYLNEHTPAETLNIKWLENTIEKVKKILDAEVTCLYFKYIEKVRTPLLFDPRKCPVCHSQMKKGMKVNDIWGSYTVCRKCYKEYFK